MSHHKHDGVTVRTIAGQIIYQNATAELNGDQVTIKSGGFTSGNSFESNGTYQFLDRDGNLLGIGNHEFPTTFQFLFSPPVINTINTVKTTDTVREGPPLPI